MIGTAPDTHVARTLGISRRTAQRRRQAAGIPPARKPSPEFDRIVAAVAELAGGDTPEARADLARRLGMRSATMIRTVLREGATEAQIAEWRGRLGS